MRCTYGGEEVREAISGRDRNIHHGQDPELGILDRKLETVPHTRFGLGGRGAIDQNAHGGDLAHVFGHGPRGTARLGIGVVGQQEEGDDG